MAEPLILVMYSKNQLVNPGAETGDFTGWLVNGSGISIVDGGTPADDVESLKCFEHHDTLLLSGEMYQDVSISATSPPDIKVTADFLPPVDLPPGSEEYLGSINLLLTYGDDTTDEIEIPCRYIGDIGGGDS